MATARFEVFGRVQGVGFRYFARRQALALELRGWVRNCEDARVEVCAAGTDTALATFERQLKTGPPAAVVSQVLRSSWPLSPVQLAALHDFNIRD